MEKEFSPVPVFPKQAVKIDSGSGGIVAGGDIKLKGNQDVIAGRDAYVYYGDTNKSKKGKTGNTYNVKSDHQSGGITAGKIEFNVTLAVPEEKSNNVTPSDNYTFSVDTASHIIQVHPKSSVWMNTFIGMDLNEISSVQPHFQNSSRTIIQGMKIDSTKILGESLFYMKTSADPATKDLSYMLHYKNNSVIFDFR